MNVLGVNCFAHDTSAALVVDGSLAGFVEEERLNRDKHTRAFPERAVQWCLAEANLRPSDLHAVAFAYRPWLDYGRALIHDVAPRFPRSWRRWAVQTYVDAALRNKARQFRHRFGYRGPIRFVDHHLAHAASSFLVSPFERAVVVTIDRGGDYVSTAAYLGEGTSLRRLFQVHNPHSLGELYSAVTWWLGFRPNADEGKTMGLAPYGRPELVEDFRRMILLGGGGRYRIDLSWAGWHLERGWVSERFLRRFGPPRPADAPLEARHEDVAFAVQAAVEEAALHVARAAARRASPRPLPLCLAGGVALNSVMNARLVAEGSFSEVFIQPAAGDAGNALGAALWVWHRLTGKPRTFQMTHAYWGPGFSEPAMRRALEERKLDYLRLDDPAAEAARLVAAGRIVGWFQGRLEVGPRALGNRSILADPRPAHMKDTLNREVKHREAFRPFAPAVLAEAASAWFCDARPSPFMLLVLPIRPERRPAIPAVCHVDGTGRLQTVGADTNPLFHRLIERFAALTGVPVVLNTSFNDRGEPIVCSPADALRTFFGTGLDALVLGPFLVTKRPLLGREWARGESNPHPVSRTGS